LGVVAVVLGYTASTTVVFLDGGWRALLRNTDAYGLLVGCSALACLQLNRVRAATWLMLAGVWLDVHGSLVIDQIEQGHPGKSVGVVLPALVVAAGFLLGSRAALLMGCSLVLSMPAAIGVAVLTGSQVSFREPIIQMFLVTTGATTLGVTALVVSFLRTFSEILQSSLANERRARELMEDAPDAVIALSSDGHIAAFNKAAEQILGVSREVALGAPYLSLPIVDPSGTWPAGTPRLRSAHGPLELQVRDGGSWLEALVRPTVRGDGSEELLVVLRDVTQRRAAETRAGELQEQLQHAQKLEAVGRLAGGIAHDFNNLLTAIGGFGSLVALSSDAKARGYGQEIVAAQKRGAALVRQLLAFARKDVVQPRPMDVAAALSEMSVLLERLIGERVELVVEAHGLCPIMADPGRFEQVILNLAANARDAMPGGGKVVIACEADAKTVTLRVSDTGVGIAPEMRSRIFEPFFTTKARSKGTGLGLSTVHGIVTDSGGSIEVESEPGQGTRFTIRWPRSFLLADRHGSSQSFRAVTGAGLSILLVEDDAQARTYVTQLLTGHGYKVEVACDAEDALQRAEGRAAPPDLLLSDVVMPGLSGPELARKLADRWPGLRTLFMSGYLGDIAERDGIDPVADLIAKPFSGRDLLERIDRKLA
jgi:two-component system cell cycle sensor histidine kinase/response regulator CckA